MRGAVAAMHAGPLTWCSVATAPRYHYVACSDLRVVSDAEEVPSNEGTCAAQATECSWNAIPQRVRLRRLLVPLISVAVIVSAFSVVAWLVFVWRRSKHAQGPWMKQAVNPGPNRWAFVAAMVTIVASVIVAAAIPLALTADCLTT